MALLQTSGERIRLVVVEDDPITCSMIARYFSQEGFEVEETGDAAACRAALQRRAADLVFIDIHLPDGSGFDLAQEIRAVSPVGIIFVTQQNSEADRVTGLESSGDDYVTKPVNLRELLARSRALLRRRALTSTPVAAPAQTAAAPRNPVLEFGPWLLDLTRREIAGRDGDPVRLTRAEFDLLAALAAADGRPLDRDYLIEVVSNRGQTSDLRTVDTLVARLRRKLPMGGAGGSIIVTVPGVGYKLGSPTSTTV